MCVQVKVRYALRILEAETDRKREGLGNSVTVNRSAQEARDPSANQILSHIAKSREGIKKIKKTEWKQIQD